MKSERLNSCLKAPGGLIDPYELFFYTYSKGNEDLDSITLIHEVLGHGTHGFKSGVNLSILSNKYSFNWNKIPRNNNDEFLNFLKVHYNLDWIEDAKIIKTDDKTVRVSTEKNSLWVKINNEKTKINLEIDDGRTDEFVAKEENGKLNIYSSREYIDSMKQVLEAIAYDKNIQLIKKEKIDSSLIDILKIQPDFPEIQEISNRVTDTIDLIQQNTGITVLRGEIYEIILHYWRVPVLSKILKKNQRKINPFETIEEIDQIVRKLDRRVAEKEIDLQLRKALLKRRFRFLGCVDFPFDLLPFGPEIIMCYELFNEKSEKRRRAIFAHLLNGLTFSASRGIHLPDWAVEALKFKSIQMLELKLQYKKCKVTEIKAPLGVFYPPLIIYSRFGDRNMASLSPSYLSRDYGYSYHLAKIASDLKISKKNSKPETLQDIMLDSAEELFYSFALVNIACDLIIVYLLILSAFSFISIFNQKVSLDLKIQVDTKNKKIVYPFGGSAHYFGPVGFDEAVDLLDPLMQDKLKEIMKSIFMPEPQIQRILQNLQRIVSETESLHPRDNKEINLEHTVIRGIPPINLEMINQIEKAYNLSLTVDKSFLSGMSSFLAGKSI